MGNTENQQGQNVITWLKQYEIIEENLHDNIMLIQSIKTNQEFYGKLLICRSKADIEKIDRLIQLKSTFDNKFVSKMVHSNKQKANNFCNVSVKYSFVFQKGEFSLKDETYNRKFKFQQFHQAQIMLILESVMKGLLFLQQIDQKHRRICSQNIFIRQDRSIFLSDPWLYSSKQTSIFKMNETGYNYPSPQKILYQNDLIDSYDEQLSDYYSLGITILELINLEPMDFIYEKGFRRVLDKKIALQINKIKRSDLRERVQILVNHYPQKRKEIEKFYQKSSSATQFIQNQRQQFKVKLRNNRQKIEAAKEKEIKIEERHQMHHHLRTESNLTVSNNYNDKRTLNNYPTARQKIVFTHNYQKRQPYIIQHQINLIKPSQNRQNRQLSNSNTNKNQDTVIEKASKLQELKSDNVKQQLHSQSIDNQSSNSIPFHQINGSLQEQLRNNCSALKEINYKKLNSLNNIIKQAQSINASIDEKSQAASEVIGHGFSAKNSMSIGLTSKRQSLDQVRTSLPEQQLEELTKPEPKITYTVSLPPQKVVNQSQIKANDVIQVQQNTLTPDRKPVKKRNHSTIKQVSQQSPSIESHSFQYEQRTIEYDIGTKYIGQLKNGKRNGQGIFYFPDGSYYEGAWKDNKMHGKGCLYYSNGRIAYDGGWYMDCFHGKGRIYNETPQEIQQEFNYNNMNFVDNYWEVYDGDFFNQKRNGNGKLKLSNGQVFVGEFMDDKVNGQGKFYQLSGNVIHGKWVEGILIREYS